MSFTLLTETPSGSDATAATSTHSCGVGLTIPVGTLCIAHFVANLNSGAGTIGGVSDDSSQSGAANTWTVQRVSEVGATLDSVVAWCVLTRSLVSGNVVTVDWGTFTCTRRCSRMICFTPSNNNVAIETDTVVTNDTASPLVGTGSGTQSRSDNCGVALWAWRGGGVASGWSGTAPSGWVNQAASISSGGTTTRVETNMRYEDNLAATTAIAAPSATVTSVSTSVIHLLTFSDAPVVVTRRAAIRVVSRTWAGR